MNLAVQIKTMSSTEIAQLTGKAKFNIHRDIKTQLLEGLYGIKDDSNLNDKQIQGITVEMDDRGYVSNYRLDKEHTLTLITGYDVKMRHTINKRWLELEQIASNDENPFTKKQQLELDLLFADQISKTLRLSNSGTLAVLGKIEKQYNLTPMLPSYGVDAPIGNTDGSSKPTKAAKELLADNVSGLSTTRFNRIAQEHGFLEKLTRPSSSKGQKEFWSVTEKGLKYGKNLTNEFNQRETQPHWYIDTFSELLREIGY